MAEAIGKVGLTMLYAGGPLLLLAMILVTAWEDSPGLALDVMARIGLASLISVAVGLALYVGSIPWVAS